MEILSFSSFGYEGEIIKVETDLRMGIPIIEIVGLPGSAVKEARERMRAAIKNSGFAFPQERILINLSPADQKKEGSCFDLPIALSVLYSSKCKNKKTLHDSKKNVLDTTIACPKSSLVKVMIMGELELSGKIRPVRGVLGAISAGAEAGIKYFIVPKENEAEASIPKNVQIYSAESLSQAYELLYKIEEIFSSSSPTDFSIEKEKLPNSELCIVWSKESGNLKSNEGFNESSFEDVKGQDGLIRALQIAAAGGHNLIAYGPPGCGKTLSLRRFQSLLPDLDFKTAHEVTRIYSIAGLLPETSVNGILIKRPPFRMPHQNASLEGMIGGAGKCMPGEISLAHGGVLFLDEAAQFKTNVLQTLRAPLETGQVTLSRAGRSSTFPAKFQLLAAINPCPCGNFGAEGKICTCMPQAVEKYWKKLTAPLLDRIDLRVPVSPPKAVLLLNKPSYSTEKLRETVKIARVAQMERFITKIGNNKTLWNKSFMDYKNASLLPADTPEVCILTDVAASFFSKTIQKKKLSGRGAHAILKLSRTIADLDSASKISSPHIEEAVSFREWIKYLPDFL